MRLYYFTPLEFAQSNLKRSRLKISLITDLNDPYELYGADLTSEDMRNRYIAWRNSFSGVAGIISFSRSWSAPIMWSHYADRHRGACLGFDVADSLAYAVRYEDKRTLLPEDMAWASNSASAERVKLITMKHSAWSYEEEVRVIGSLKHEENGLYFEPFSEVMALREVILGVRCTADDLSELTALAGDIDATIDVYCAALSHTAFAVIRG
jgi:Protein of unknown function (DUF2971)